MTGRPLCNDTPKSPTSARPSHLRYWTGTGLSNPYSTRMRSTSSGLASSGVTARIGSTGPRWTRAKQMTVTPREIGIAYTIRRMTYSMAPESNLPARDPRE